MQVRKLQEMGGATLLVSLPKEWVRRTALKKGSVVAMDESPDGGLLIYPSKEGGDEHQGTEIDIAYPSKFSNEGIPNEVTAAYLLGYDLIRVTGKDVISSRDRDRIISSIKLLIGLEVVEEDARSITSQFLVDKMAVEPSKIFRRISTIVRAMISDTLRQLTSSESNIFDSVAQRDDEVDRLHFLLVRLIRTAVREPLSASKFGLSAIDCLDYRVAASSLETAGDYAVELSNSVSRLGTISPAVQAEIEEVIDLLDIVQSNAVRSFIQRDFKLAQRVMEDSLKLEKLISTLREISNDSPAEILHLADTIERIARCQRDIADLVSPMRPA
jgi:phosphate uptake regulator